MKSNSRNAGTSMLRVEFSVNGRPVRVEARMPEGPVRLDQLLPALKTMDDRLIGVAVANEEISGERVTCAKGCAACCQRQPVPITPPEAFALARLVEALPEPRRTVVRASFAAAVQRLRAADLYDIFMQRNPEMTRDAAIAIARRYVALGLVCPFLLDQECSIYTDRPFVCRQYLVTSPAELCVAPLDNPIRTIRMPAAFATAMLHAGEKLSGRSQYSVPLVLALDSAAANRSTMERTYDAKSALDKVIRGLKEA